MVYLFNEYGCVVPFVSSGWTNVNVQIIAMFEVKVLDLALGNVDVVRACVCIGCWAQKTKAIFMNVEVSGRRCF